MAKRKQVIEDNIWTARIDSADKYYHEWETLFMCDTLEKYYEGKQWKSQRELNYRPYVINKIYETIQIKIAEFVPSNPQFLVTTKPANSQYDLESAIVSAQLKQDVLSQIIDDDRQHFSEELERAYKDSLFRFGIIEVGYSADWILNPNAPKPLLKGNTDTRASDRSKMVQEPDVLPMNERIYIKHIPAKRFRVGGLDHRYLQRCGWIGYWDWVYRDDLLSMKRLMNRDKIENASAADDFDVETHDRNDKQTAVGALKIWNIWDTRSKLHLLILDDGHTTIYQQKYKRIPLFDLRQDFRVVTDGFYPVPPVFHWISPQDEINEIREQLRNHRRRFNRKFQVVVGKIDDEEIDKFETGPDGTLVKVKETNAISAIESADLGNSAKDMMELSADDLNRISGTSDPARGVSERGTATEANIVNAVSSVRQKKDMARVAKWLSGIGRETLLTIKEKFTLDFMISRTSDEGTGALEVQDERRIYQNVTSEDLDDGYDFRINVDVTSISVTAQQDEKQKFMEFLSVLQNFGPLVIFDPVIVREAAYRVGYRNMKVIRAFQKQALLAELGRMQSQAGAMGAPQGAAPNNAGQAIAAQQTPPTLEKIRNQQGRQLQ